MVSEVEVASRSPLVYRLVRCGAVVGSILAHGMDRMGPARSTTRDECLRDHRWHAVRTLDGASWVRSTLLSADDTTTVNQG